MEWMNRAAPRSAQSAGTTVTPSTGAPAPHHNGNGGHSKKKTVGGFSPMRLVAVLLVAAAMLLVLGVIWLSAFGAKVNPESEYVDQDKMQAVFLTGGQVYFGKIRALNRGYVGLTDIYYLRVNQQVQPKQGEQAQAQDIALVKLGCELHGPDDQMLINRDQVIFWENLKKDGQVAKAVEAYSKANPDGQKCETSNGQSGSNNTTTNTNTTTNNSSNNSNSNSNNSGR